MVFGMKPQKTIVNYIKADVWSMGILFFYMLEKKHPFSEFYLKHLIGKPLDEPVQLTFEIIKDEAI